MVVGKATESIDVMRAAHPLYDTVRSTSVFQGFLARLGLPD
jgi:hypothetical protein